MNVIRGHLALRELREMGEPLVGLAHLWLRHLPASFVNRMACLNMEWRDARDALLDRRLRQMFRAAPRPRERRSPPRERGSGSGEPH